MESHHKDELVKCDMCRGAGQTLSGWKVRTGGQRLRCPKCLGKGQILRSDLRSERVRRLRSTGSTSGGMSDSDIQRLLDADPAVSQRVSDGQGRGSGDREPQRDTNPYLDTELESHLEDDQTPSVQPSAGRDEGQGEDSESNAPSTYYENRTGQQRPTGEGRLVGRDRRGGGTTPPDPPLTARRGGRGDGPRFPPNSVILVVLLVAVTLVGFLFVVDEGLRRNVADWLGSQLTQIPTPVPAPAPIIIVLAETPAPTMVPTPDSVATIVAMVEEAIPPVSPVIAHTPTPTPPPTSTATVVPPPTRNEYSIEGVEMKLVESGQGTLISDWSVTVRNVSASSRAIPIHMSVDGSEPELVAFISGILQGEAETFVFTKEVVAGSRTVTFAVADAIHEVLLEQLGGISGTGTPPPTVLVRLLNTTPTPNVATVPQPTQRPKPRLVQAADTATPIPTSTPTPRPTATHTATPIPTSTPTPRPTATHTATPIPTSTPTPRPTATHTATPILSFSSSALKRYMLELINTEREQEGLHTLTMGNNPAAQSHADSALRNCFSSHWGVDGLKPYMRYSRAGGYQSNGENGYGIGYCIVASDGFSARGDMKHEILKAMNSFMSSVGHRRNILRPQHRKVNIGIAHDRYNIRVYQHFEGDYVTYSQLPAIRDGVLTMSGTVRNGPEMNDVTDLGVQIYHDPPPRRLTRGQLAMTYCYDHGLQVAALRRPVQAGWSWTKHEFVTEYRPCPDPYNTSSDAPAPQSYAESKEAGRKARESPRESQSITVPWVTADRWDIGDQNFAVSANLRDIVRQHGPGVYTVLIWASKSLVSDYSIFLE